MADDDAAGEIARLRQALADRDVEVAVLRQENAEQAQAIAARDAEAAELRAAVDHCSVVVAGMRWLLREHGVPEPTTPAGKPIWPERHQHSPGRA